MKDKFKYTNESFELTAQAIGEKIVLGVYLLRKGSYLEAELSDKQISLDMIRQAVNSTNYALEGQTMVLLVRHEQHEGRKEVVLKLRQTTRNDIQELRWEMNRQREELLQLKQTSLTRMDRIEDQLSGFKGVYATLSEQIARIRRESLVQEKALKNTVEEQARRLEQLRQQNTIKMDQLGERCRQFNLNNAAELRNLNEMNQRTKRRTPKRSD